MSDFEEFQDMSREEFDQLVQEAMTIQNQCHLQVLSHLVEQLLLKSGATRVDDLPVTDCIRELTRQNVLATLPKMADEDMDRISKISKILMSLDFYKPKP